MLKLTLTLTLLIMTAYSLVASQPRKHMQAYILFNDLEGISAKIHTFIQGIQPRLEAEFHALLYPFFLAGVGFQRNGIKGYELLY